MTTPDYFSLSFWRSALNHVIYGAAGGAMNMWVVGGIGSVDSDTHLSIPGWGVAAGALSGALLGFLLSLLGKAIPGTPETSFVPAAKTPPARKAPVKAPAKATTTADLKPPVKRAPAKRAPVKKPPVK
ncbi:hypothetical protein A5677_00495 [Mycobacterium malmoense]|uniref:Uncharacterized protein n=1 Tax=Mycobacterium malmoense TaxID=1780 RepID=A0A1B9CI67_MYCMA|nr:hypothetical protein [Mycobacterium malmoense]OCB41885.1 hypothetical protein A5677_00495 [Mycobacterium malmoense]